METKEQKLISLLQKLGTIELSAIKKDLHGNIFHFYNQKRNLHPEEVKFLQENGINVKSFITHKGKHTYYSLNNHFRTGHNHPFMQKNKNEIIECYDPQQDHIPANNIDLFNICLEEKRRRNCEKNDTDSCKWIIQRMKNLNIDNDAYEYPKKKSSPLRISPQNWRRSSPKRISPKRSSPKRSSPKRSSPKRIRSRSRSPQNWRRSSPKR